MYFIFIKISGIQRPYAAPKEANPTVGVPSGQRVETKTTRRMFDTLVGSERRALTAAEFSGLTQVPTEAEWFANIRNPRTRRAYQIDLKDFMAFTGIRKPEEFRIVTRAHVIAWRKTLEQRELSPSTIQRKLAALSALFQYLCERNGPAINPVDGVEHPRADNNEGKTLAIGDAQARALLQAPPLDTLKGKRDRAILATFLYHGLRMDSCTAFLTSRMTRLARQSPV
jgi:site-specific recombinase XerD